MIAGSEAARASDALAREEAANSAASNAPAPTYGVDVGPLRGSAGTLAAEGRTLAAPGERAEVESEAPTVLSPFVVNASEDQGHYRANSTLAGTRVRTDLKDVASSISVVTEQFLEDTRAANGKNLLAYSPKAAASDSPDSVTTTTAAASASLVAGAPVLSPFEVDASQDGKSYNAIETEPAEKLADAELQSVLNGPGKVSFVTSSIDQGGRLKGARWLRRGERRK